MRKLSPATLRLNGNKSGDAEGDVGRQIDHRHCAMVDLGLCPDAAGWLSGHDGGSQAPGRWRAAPQRWSNSLRLAVESQTQGSTYLSEFC